MALVIVVPRLNCRALDDAKIAFDGEQPLSAVNAWTKTHQPDDTTKSRFLVKMAL